MSGSGKKIIVDEVEAMGHLRTKAPGSDLWSRSAQMTKPIRQGQLPPVPEHMLFQSHNVTGSTGTGGPSPSVYYRSGDTFSHVTTDHPKVNNIGRSKVRTSSDYQIFNSPTDGKSREYYRGGVRHESRNPYQSVQSSAEQQRLHTTASAHPNPKAKY